jgi:hypothetical protein
MASVLVGNTYGTRGHFRMNRFWLYGMFLVVIAAAAAIAGTPPPNPPGWAASYCSESEDWDYVGHVRTYACLEGTGACDEDETDNNDDGYKVHMIEATYSRTWRDSNNQECTALCLKCDYWMWLSECCDNIELTPEPICDGQVGF